MANRREAAVDADWVHIRQMAVTRQLTASVLRALQPLRRQGRVMAAHFQRKDPGLRWRIATTDPAAARAALAPVLARYSRRAQGLLAWGESVYEPEAPLFGGRHAMDIVHTLFDADTAAWSRLASLRRRKALPFTESALLLAQGNELFASALDGRPEEVWDAWCRLAVFHGLRPVSPGGESRSRPMLSQFAEHPQAQAARPALMALAQAQVQAGRALALLARQGQLEQGLRGVLAAASLFAWNRVGLTTFDRHHVLAHAMKGWGPHVAPAPAPRGGVSLSPGDPCLVSV